jgi:hypothetical protein
MSYTPATDFLALLRGGSPDQLGKAPALDIIVSALARANIVNLHVGLSPPTSQQPITAWLKTQNPTYSAEGALWLWDALTGAYAEATPYLFGRLLATASGLPQAAIQTGSGSPLNTLGANGDFYVDTATGNFWGPKAAGAWPVIPLVYGVKSTVGPNLIVGNSSGAAPLPTIGQNGQYFEDVTTGNVYGPKAAGAWPAVPAYSSPSQLPSNIALFGRTAGAAPSDAIGSNGQYFQDTDSGNVYGPKAAGAWPAVPALYGDTRYLLPAALPASEMTQNRAYSRTFEAFGLTAPITWSLSSGSLPSGLNLNASTGSITGTPVAAGSYTFQLTATDANGVTAKRSYSGNVNAALSIAITPVSLTPLVVGAAFIVQLSASNGSSPYKFALTAGALPAGLKLDNSTGHISGVPTTAGAYSFTITTTDANGNQGTQAFSGTVWAGKTELADNTAGLTNGVVSDLTPGAPSDGAFTRAGATLTCVLAGEYVLSASVEMYTASSAAGGTSAAIDVLKNAAVVHRVTENGYAASGPFVTSVNLTFALTLAAGDTLRLTGVYSVLSGSGMTYTLRRYRLLRVR